MPILTGFDASAVGMGIDGTGANTGLGVEVGMDITSKMLKLQRLHRTQMQILKEAQQQEMTHQIHAATSSNIASLAANTNNFASSLGATGTGSDGGNSVGARANLGTGDGVMGDWSINRMFLLQQQQNQLLQSSVGIKNNASNNSLMTSSPTSPLIPPTYTQHGNTYPTAPPPPQQYQQQQDIPPGLFVPISENDITATSQVQAEYMSTLLSTFQRNQQQQFQKRQEPPSNSVFMVTPSLVGVGAVVDGAVEMLPERGLQIQGESGLRRFGGSGTKEDVVSHSLSVSVFVVKLNFFVLRY
jgi:hypothetical protein